MVKLDLRLPIFPTNSKETSGPPLNLEPCVRGDKLGQIIHPPKGIPDDATQEIREPYEEWGSDAHSASYYYLSELLECDYGKMNKSELEKNRLDYFFYDVLNRCKEISDDTNKFRIIFWFDN